MTQPPDQPPRGGFGAPRDHSPGSAQGSTGGHPDQPPQPGGSGAPHPPSAPGGGFGAPQAPRQGTPPPPAQPPQPQPGYGYPQQPPGGPGPYAQPGPGPYGAPAAPGPYGQPGPYGPPQQPGPYGPPQQPGPYGQPQPGPYGQQPGYGYPQPQFPGAPGTPPPGGSRNPFRGRPAAVVGAAVAALLVVGGTVWAVTSGDDGGKKPVAEKSGGPGRSASGAPANPGDGSGDGREDPENLNDGRKPGEAKVLWYKEAPDTPGSGADAPGMWITGSTAVKAAYKQLLAYAVGDGKPAWDPVTFPQKICAVTPQKSADDKVVVAYMSGASDRAKCNQLQQIDLNTGAKGWSGEVAEGALFDSTLSVELSISGRTLMVGRSQSGTAYDIGTGKKLFDKQKYGAACFPTAFAGGARLIAVASCGAGRADAHDEVQELDPTTGTAKWTKKIPKGWSVARAYSVDPVILYMTNEDKKHWNISTLKADGSVLSQVDTKASFRPECGWAVLERDLQGCRGVASDADTLYLPTEATSGPNEIVAISLATGKEKWRVKSPADTTMLPVGVEGGRLVAYVEPSYSSGGRVVSVPTAGTRHTATTLLQNPQATAQIENGFFSRDFDWVDGRFYLSTTRLSGRDEAKEKLMLAFGK